MALFYDRSEAGRQLAAYLVDYARNRDCIVLALPRGGVPVGFEIAKALHAPLDVYIVRKLGVPGHEELAMGAVASDGKYVIDEGILDAAGVTRVEFESVMTRELREIRRREATYRAGRPQPDLSGKTVIVVDDGLATGSTMSAALIALRQRKPAELAVAVPVAPADAVGMLERYADRVFCPYQPAYFGAVGFYYSNFTQLEDEDVARLLAAAQRERTQWNVA
jgi:putative phosphoribosyl transferase